MPPQQIEQINTYVSLRIVGDGGIFQEEIKDKTHQIRHGPHASFSTTQEKTNKQGINFDSFRKYCFTQVLDLETIKLNFYTRRSLQTGPWFN